jgi:hypothetical protein
VAGTLVVIQASPAGAVPGVQKFPRGGVGERLDTDQDGPRGLPGRLRVLGGGGWIFTGGADADKVGLTELRPVHPLSGVDQYVVTAEEVTRTSPATGRSRHT